jgi:hypothetical protein
MITVSGRQPIRADGPSPHWLQALGLRFDPFVHLEASRDDRIGEYIVNHTMFDSAWRDGPALICAPPGGGKTTMRIFTTRASWVGFGGVHPFPIPYLLPDHIANGRPLTPDQHLRAIVQAGAAALLVGLAFRPERLSGLSDIERHAVAGLLAAALPAPLNRYLGILRAQRSPHALPPVLERSYQLDGAPAAEALLELCDRLEATADTPLPMPSAPDAQFEQLMTLLCGPLRFGAVYLLLDGLDAFPETIAHPNVAAEWVVWLVAQAPVWASRRIYVKGFVPLEVELALRARLPAQMARFQISQLRWSPAELAAVVRQRVSATSGRRFDSLDALASPEVRQIETQLAQHVAPLPRAIVQVARRVLLECERRLGGEAGALEQEDIQAALAWHATQWRGGH